MLLHISFASKTEHSVSCVITGQIFGIKADDRIPQATSSVLDGTDGTVQDLNRFNFNSMVNEPVRTDGEPVHTDSVPVH